LSSVEALGNAGEQEVHGAQAEDGEHVRGQHDERVGGDREDGRDRVDREDQVGDFNQHQCEEERRRVTHAIFPGKEVLAVELGT
jgi:hypothetical protein